jgi:hypothetical protein
VPCWMVQRGEATWMPCGEGDGHWPMIPRKLQEAINFEPELSFGQGYSRWKALGEQKEMVSSFEEFREVVGK